MAPKKAAKKEQPKVYDYSGLEKGTSLKAESDGSWYAAEVVAVSTAKNRSKAPVKITYKGYAGYDEWVGGDRLRSKALKVTKPEKKEDEDKKERKPLEVNFGYWKIRGLGSIFRMIFEYKGVKYTDNQYTLPEKEKWFAEDKPKILEKNPLANLPYLECGNDCVCQTNSCLAYIGDKLRLSGRGPKQSLLNSQLLCEIYDVRNDIINMSYKFKKFCRDEAEFKEKASKHIEGGPFSKFEAILEKGGTDYFCGKLPLTSDFHIWEMLDVNKILAVEKLGKTEAEFFEKIPKCKAFYDKFRALPTLQTYFESDAYKFEINNSGAGTFFP